MAEPFELLPEAQRAGLARAVELARHLPLGSVVVSAFQPAYWSGRFTLQVQTPAGIAAMHVTEKDLATVQRTQLLRFWREKIDGLIDQLVAGNRPPRAVRPRTLRKKVQVQAGGYKRALALTGLPE